MSDILIRGMEMPRNCEECDVKVVCKNYWKLIREQYTRPSWCPLVPVPPHGRLIDADALMKDGWKLQKEVMRMGGYAIHEMPLNYPDIPTIIPANEEYKR